MVYNKLQTPIESDLVDSLSREEKAELIDILSSSVFIQNLTSPLRKTTDKANRVDGKIVIDLTNPHILEDMDYFRQAAIHYQTHGVYTHLHKNTHPFSEYSKYWKEEIRRCLEGLVRPDGEWITGDYYWYLNYSPIPLSKRVKGNKKRADRVVDFPKVYDGDYLFFHYVEQARDIGSHGAVLKSRGKGFSLKNGSQIAKRFILGDTMEARKMVKSYAIANEREYLTKDGVLNKFMDIVDFCANNTPFPRLKLKDSWNEMHWHMGYVDTETDTRKGNLNEVFGVTLKNDPNRARGKRGSYIYWEEMGKFADFLTAWQIARPSVEEDDVAYGFMLAAGCLTENNYVWDNEGNLCLIKDLDVTKGILGFNQDTGVISKEPITYWQPPTSKECVRIETNTGRHIECSLDHPILTSHQTMKTMQELPNIGKRKRKSLKKVVFKEAQDIKLGDQVAVADEVNVFGNKKMWNPRLVGLLIGDGSYGKDKTPVLSNCDKEVLNYVEYNFITKLERTYLTKKDLVYKELRILNITKPLRELGIYGQTKDKKTLPVGIHSYSKEDICEVLGGIYDADGCFNKKPSICFDTAYKSLALEVLLLLQKLGIHGNIMFKKPNFNNPIDRNGWYRLEIKDKRSILRFQENIHLLPSYKQERLDSYIEILKNKKERDAEHLKGIRFERVTSIEYIGLKSVYNLTAGNTHTYLGNGIITHNTGGSGDSDFYGANEIFYNPRGYNVFPMPNVFDKNAKPGTECSFFFPDYLNKLGFYDENGNSDIIGGLVELVHKRNIIKYNTSDPNAIVQEKAEHPIYPQEAVMRKEGSAFPVFDLKERLSEIKPQLEEFVSPHYLGRLANTGEGKVEWKTDGSLTPIRSFPLQRGLDTTGCIEIFEQPKKGPSGEPIRFRYIMGVDPVDSDTGTSLASAFVFDTFTATIVAEYTARPRFTNDFYENVLRLAVYYNAIVNYENNIKGLYTYFYQKNRLHLLCGNPQILKDMGLQSGSNYGNNSKGTRATEGVNRYARRLQKDWMLAEAYNTTDEHPLMNLHNIRSIPYMEEAVAWNSDGNFDRISAMGMVMILWEDIRKNSESAQSEKSSNSFATSKFFTDNYPGARERAMMDFFKEQDKLAIIKDNKN